MKRAGIKALALIAALSALCACAPVQKAEQPAPAETPFVENTSELHETTPAPADTPDGIALTVFVPNENADGLNQRQVQAADSPRGVIEALVSSGALPDVDYGKNITFSVEEETLNFSGEEETLRLIRLDVGDGFGRAAAQTGTAGETLMIQALVNTFIVRYEADALLLTIEGAVLETGHAAYDAPIRFDELAQTENWPNDVSSK